MSEHARIVLTCHHTLEFSTAPPLLGAEVWCVKCGSMETVTDAPPEYRIRCRRCTFSRMCGFIRQDAETVAARHVKRNGHPVALYNGHRLVYVIGSENTREHVQQGTLFDKPVESDV